MPTYYVNASGSTTFPFNTAARGATTLNALVAAIISPGPGVSAFADGSIIKVVNGGTISETLTSTIFLYGTTLTIEADDPSDKPTFYYNCPGDFSVSVYGYLHAVTSAECNLIVRNIKFTGAVGTNNQLFLAAMGYDADSLVEKCELNYVLLAARNITLKNNIFITPYVDYSSPPLRLWCTVDCTVSNNDFYFYGGTGGGYSNAIVRDNLFTDLGATANKIVNNIIYAADDESSNGILIDIHDALHYPVSGDTFNYNDIINCTGYKMCHSDSLGVYTEDADGANDIELDPQWTTPGSDFTIPDGSPCISAGIGRTTYTYVPSDDFIDTVRPLAIVDIGAYELSVVVAADFSATPLMCVFNTEVSFTNLSTISPVTWVIDTWDWDFGDGTAHGTTENPTHTYSTPGTYTVTLVATNTAKEATDTEVKTDYITIRLPPDTGQHIAYAIEVTTDQTEVTDADFGCQEGVFRFISDRPGYDGIDPFPLWEDGSYNLEIWYEGWITEKGLGNPSRNIDITISGEYGTFSGFNVNLENTTKFWDFLQTNSVYLSNRSIKFYTILDGVFYQCWDGVIDKINYDETQFQLQCIDKYNTVHKYMPPNYFTTSNPDQSGMSDQSQAEPIPIVFGDVPYSKIYNTLDNTLENNYIDLTMINPGKVNETYYNTAGVIEYIQDPLVGSNSILNIFSSNKSFTKDELVDKYVQPLIGENSDDKQFINIIGNEASIDLTALTVHARYFIAYFECRNTDIIVDELIGIYMLPGTYASRYEIVSNSAVNMEFTVDGDTIKYCYAIVKENWTTPDDSSDMRNHFADYKLPTYTVSDTVFVRCMANTKIQTTVLSGSGNTYYNTIIYMSRQFSGTSSTAIELYNTNISFYHPEKPAGAKDSEWKTQVPIFLTGANSNTWFVRIADIVFSGIVSDGTISEFKTDAYGRTVVYTYDSTTNTYSEVTDLIDSVTVDSEGKTTINFVTSHANADGEMYYYSYIPLEISSTDNKALSDRDRETGKEIKVYANKGSWGRYTKKIAPLKAFNKDDFEGVYIGFDMNYYTEQVGAKIGNVLGISWKIYDVYGFAYTPDDNTEPNLFFSMYNIYTNPHSVYNFIPNDLYRNNGNDRGEYSIFDTTFDAGEDNPSNVRDYLQIPDAVLDIISKKDSVISAEVTLEFTKDDLSGPGQSDSFIIDIKEFMLFGIKTFNVLDNELYTNVKGELLSDGSETNTVYRAFRKILEDIDKIPVADIDYGNLATTRDDWMVGRQVTERRGTLDYLKELASQSFVGIFPTRTGKRKLTAWRDLETTPYTHDSTIIIRESIVGMNKTQIDRVYNNFRLNYSWNYASGKFDRLLYISYVDNDHFLSPSETYDDGETVLHWYNYFGGMTLGSYSDCKMMWDICNRSWYIHNVVSKDLPKNLSELFWYNDPLIFDSSTGTGLGVNMSAFKYLKNLVAWSTRQKEEITYSVPLNSTTLQYELLDKVYFTDAIYTNDEARTGWIETIEVDTDKDVINLKVILDPTDILDPDDNLIIERGKFLNEDTINESGTRDDQYIETGYTGL